MLRRIADFIFYGNYFYGCCTVALAIEAGIQQQLPLNSLYFYLLLYLLTVIFYTYAYVQEGTSKTNNQRINWYIRNHTLVKKTQLTWLLLAALLSIYLLVENFNGLQKITVPQLLFAAIAGIAALAYYGIPTGKHSSLNLRNTGWFKPFAIGFVWAILVTYIPVLWYQAEAGIAYHFTGINSWFFIKNFMYISLLAILFDIKDYAADHNRRLKTFVVTAGLRKTIFTVIIPLAVTGFLSLLVFASLRHFHILRITINSIPFILLIAVAWSMQRRKSILYYLVVIDGLMLVKALCGITAALVAG